MAKSTTVRLRDDRSIKGTAKEAELRMRRQRYARKRANDARVAKIKAARYEILKKLANQHSSRANY
jgi:hypothetical protein